ncbi:MAG TPA: hypothetical protein VKZ53_13320 [Candidatus Angelobacter sp.]|nr:hypothetical protein [Candidatus Angelobacter sp.]
MGTSFVEYKKFGFWTRDRFLESWLISLVKEMQELPHLEAWQKALIEHWHLQASIGGGCMSLDLDQFLIDRAREESVLTVAQQALGHTPALGHRTGELFIDLLAGRLKTTESSPIDYLNDPQEARARQ